MEPAGARGVHCGSKRLSDQMARLPVLRRIPVHGLVPDFFQCGLPTSVVIGGNFVGGWGRGFV